MAPKRPRSPEGSSSGEDTSDADSVTSSDRGTGSPSTAPNRHSQAHPTFVPVAANRTQIRPLLQCVLCLDVTDLLSQRLLSAATTLPCGHSICSSHVPGLLEKIASSSTATSVSDCPTCPIPGCASTAPASRNQPTSHTIHPSSSVAVYSAIRPSTYHPSLLREDILRSLKPDIKIRRILELEAGDDEGDGRELGSRAETEHSVSLLLRDKSPSPGRKRKRPRLLPGRAFSKSLKSILTCEVCFMLLYQPVTVCCGHTFCALCLQRTVDQDPKCPLCRSIVGPELRHILALMDARGSDSVPTNKALLGILLIGFSKDYMARRQALLDELTALHQEGFTVPLYYGAEVIFPGIRARLTFSKPEQRLMLRRILSWPDAQLGAMLTPAMAGAAGDAPEGYGTVVAVTSVQFLPDNKAVAEVEALSKRFRVLDTRPVDGYSVAKMVMFDDLPDLQIPLSATGELSSNTPNPEDTEPTTDAMIEQCRRFIDELGTDAAPWIVKRYSDEYGEQPVGDPVAFGWWAASHLPITHDEKSKLLAIRSPKLRLQIICHWISTLSDEWWYSRGCTIC